MTPRVVLLPVLVLTGVVLGPFTVPATLPAQGLTPIQTARLQRVDEVLDLGPHGLLFTRRVPRLAKDGVGGPQRQVFLLRPGAAPERILAGGAGFALWEDKVTFTGRVEGAEHPEVLAYALESGKVSRITTTPAGLRSYQWSPDFAYIAYTQIDPLPPARAAAHAAGFRQEVYDEDFRSISLWLWTRSTGESQRLTTNGSVFDFEWSPDSERLALALAPRNLVDDSYMFKRIHLVDRAGRLTKVADNPGKLGDMAWSPDGRYLAHISAADRRDPHAGMLYLLDTEGGSVKALTQDLRGMVHHIAWAAGDRIQALISEGVHTYLCSIDPGSGAIERHTGGAGIAFESFVGDGEEFLAVGSTASHPAEAWRVNRETGATARLTDSNPWLADVTLGRQQVVRITARDGLTIEGLLLHPIDQKDGKRRPLVIVVHGGPEAHFSDGWNTSYSAWGQNLCARGYFVWYPNYRSSTGYGVEFTKHDHGDLMGGEFNDHLDAIAHFADAGLIDPQRVGIGGGSYGGCMAAWAATKGTRHFAAAVSFVPFVDIRTKWYSSDIPWEFFLVHYQEKHAVEQSGYLADRSPLTWAKECRTPLLLLGGTADPRVHPSQPHMLYRAVKFHTPTPVRYVRYPGEGHGNRTNTNQFDYLLRTLRWFDHFLAPGAERSDAPPPFEIDYSDWYDSK